jgi:RND family efflux transporter MFP subunit
MSDKPGRSFFWLKVVLAVAVLVAIGAAAVVYVRATAKVEVVVSGDAIDARPGSVTVKEEYSMDMKSEVAGRVLKVGYTLFIGMHVKEGDLLVHLDTGDIQIAIDQAQNMYNSTKARIGVGSAATYLLETAKSELANTERLFKMGQESDSNFQKARRAVETQEQQLKLENVRDQQDLITYETDLRSKKRQLEKMTITAPFEGEVSAVFAHPGDLINIGSPIVTLITTSRIVEAKISEEDFANVKVGEKASVTFLPYGEFLYNGTVKKILPTADPETQRHLVDLEVTDIEPAKLIPGITGEVSIVVGRRHADAIIPRRALFNESVYVVRDGVVELRKVKTGYLWFRGAEVTEGLKPGEQVIVEDLDQFRDGNHIRVAELPSDVVDKRQ